MCSDWSKEPLIGMKHKGAELIVMRLSLVFHSSCLVPFGKDCFSWLLWWLILWLIFQNGQTPLSIAQCLGYISVVEILKETTTVTVTEYDEKLKYKLMSPEIMMEAAMSDEDDDDEGQILIRYLSGLGQMFVRSLWDQIGY